ncbi:hypothetical protein RHSIM_Rhsim05G0206800 [Rhododendron simsii]|uniref:Uncharacterized protein n=1 Tax=Rhododendron simsii TaxID=118357 RepID=A0A834GV28_RHOSS|nr:hypothetical protein RHSIM_Rhsim05G0206800 [Rhododendron simsii]
MSALPTEAPAPPHGGDPQGSTPCERARDRVSLKEINADWHSFLATLVANSLFHGQPTELAEKALDLGLLVSLDIVAAAVVSGGQDFDRRSYLASPPLVLTP